MNATSNMTVEEFNAIMAKFISLIDRMDYSKFQLAKLDEKIALSRQKYKESLENFEKSLDPDRRKQVMARLHKVNGDLDLMRDLLSMSLIRQFMIKQDTQPTILEVTKAKHFVTTKISHLLYNSYENKPFEVIKEKQCIHLTTQIIKDLVIRLLNDPELPRPREIRADLTGFSDEIDFDGLVEMINKVPNLRYLYLDLKPSDEQIKKLAQAVLEATKPLDFIDFDDVSQKQRFADTIESLRKSSQIAKPISVAPQKQITNLTVKQPQPAPVLASPSATFPPPSSVSKPNKSPKLGHQEVPHKPQPVIPKKV